MQPMQMRSVHECAFTLKVQGVEELTVTFSRSNVIAFVDTVSAILVAVEMVVERVDTALARSTTAVPYDNWD